MCAASGAPRPEHLVELRAGLGLLLALQEEPGLGVEEAAGRAGFQRPQTARGLLGRLWHVRPNEVRGVLGWQWALPLWVETFWPIPT